MIITMITILPNSNMAKFDTMRAQKVIITSGKNGQAAKAKLESRLTMAAKV